MNVYCESDRCSGHFPYLISFKTCSFWIHSIKEEIKERIVLGNTAYYANQALFKSKLLSSNSKLKMCWTVVRPVVMNACETWVLKESIKQKLLVLERKILRTIFGRTKERDGT
jgi:hypothetical protein